MISRHGVDACGAGSTWCWRVDTRVIFTHARLRLPHEFADFFTSSGCSGTALLRSVGTVYAPYAARNMLDTRAIHVHAKVVRHCCLFMFALASVHARSNQIAKDMQI